MAPMLLDTERMSAGIIVSVAWVSASWIVASYTRSWSGAVNRVRGLMVPAWSAADTVMTLLTEPGSYTSVTDRLRRSFGFASAKLFGSNHGYVAIARISPVRGFITMTVPPDAWFRRTASASDCC